MSHSAPDLFLQAGIALVAFVVLFAAARVRLGKGARRESDPMD